jgi:hypothetical protein
MSTKDLESDASGSIAAVREVGNLSHRHLIFSHKAELGKELKDAQVDIAAA